MEQVLIPGSVYAMLSLQRGNFAGELPEISSSIATILEPESLILVLKTPYAFRVRLNGELRIIP